MRPRSSFSRQLADISQELEKLLPRDVKLCLDFIQNCQGPLHAEELKYVQGCDDARRKEFVAGRNLARLLLSRLKAEDGPLLRKADGSPLWPNGIVGSISHKSAVCGVLATASEEYSSLGLDIEIPEDLEADIWNVFSTPKELEQYQNTNFTQGQFANVLFSAKEAVFKAICQQHTALSPPNWRDLVITISQGGVSHCLKTTCKYLSSDWEGVILIHSKLQIAAVWNKIV